MGYGDGGYGEGGYGDSGQTGFQPGTVGAIAQGVSNRLEESDPAFWSIEGEIFPAIVEGMNEATLITGEPQVRPSEVFSVFPSTVFAPLSMPAGAVALTRVEGSGNLQVKRCWMSDLDKHFPGWETAVGDEPKYWFPFGLTKFGIYPNLTVQVDLVISYVQIPVLTAPPYNGGEPVPFQNEYMDGFADYAAHILRLKEATAEFDQSFAEYNRFLKKCESLSNFAYRKNSLRFSRSAGVQSGIGEQRVK